MTDVTVTIGGGQAVGAGASAPVDEPQKIETPKAPEPEAKAPEPEVKAEPEVNAEPEPDEPKRPSGSERQKRKAERLAMELAEERAKREDLERRLSGGDPKQGKPGVDREPSEQDFPNDYFAYERAKVAWEVRQAIREERGVDDRRRSEYQRNQARMEAVEDYAENLDRVKERIPDFDAVVSKANVKIPDELADEILSVGEKAPLITYYLAQNPAKLAELVNMTGKALAREVGRIEGRVHMPQAKKATEASPPPSIPRGGASPVVDLAKTDSMEAYIKARKAGVGGKASY